MDYAGGLQDKSLEDIFIKNMQGHTVILKKHEQDLWELFSVALQNGFEKAYRKQQQGKGKIKYISVSALLSSMISESYSLGINFYDERFYIDEVDVFTEFKIPYISDFIKENTEQTRKLLSYHRQPYKESDVAEIQKVYVLAYIVQVVEMLKSNISHILSKIQAEGVECEDVVTITFGAYMEQQMEIYAWEVGK